MDGPELPEIEYLFNQLEYHAMVNIKNDLTMVIGGDIGWTNSAKTLYYDHSKEEWLHGPLLNQERRNHAVGIVMDETTKEKLVTVTGGYSGGANYGANLDSTEVLLADTWSKGKK